MHERKKRRRRGRYGFLLTFFVVAALVFLFIFTSGLFFKIKEIRVEGVSAANPQEIVDLSGFSHGENIFLINKIAAVRSIIAKLPHVKAVRIKRELPGTVVMIITEAVPAAMIEHRGSYWIVDTQGEILESVSILTPPALPRVKGMALLDPMPGTKIYPAFDDAAKLDPLFDLLRSMREEGVLDGVGEIDISKLSAVRFTYAGKYTVELGTPEHLTQKFQVFTLALEQISDRGPGTLHLDGAAEDKPVRFIPDGP